MLLELIKNDVNQGIEPRLFFYRDNQKNEVDIIKQNGNDLIAIEIKSSQTFHKNFLKPIEKFKTIAKDTKVHGTIVYAGNQQQQINHINTLNYQNLKTLA